ncbi:glycosyltransferase family 4 protein [Xylanibacter muris]|uniref:Glycosyltransferase family 4 protein n=1 Tax=Xylanibacter muris TaxID=2736290 RepID=A0ABX2AIW9_9BACT|nr:glycosyltransferase family 4 protein [Xylanibacter muris]NPD90894.1 glycosyltransferase family 4 protein [Xylanibacter muris]
MKRIIIGKSIANKVMMVSVIFRTTKPCGGGVSTVLECYDRYFDGLRHIPTWKYTNPLNKAWYFFYHWVELVFLLIFDRRLKIVHIHTAAGSSFKRKMIMAKTARTFGKKVILHMHAADFVEFYETASDKDKIINNIKACDILIVLSPQWKDFFVKIGIGEKNIIILNNIVTPPSEEVLKKRIIQSPNIQPQLRFLFLGWLGKRKGIWDLLDVIVTHHENLKGRFMLRFGGNEFENEIKKLIKDNNLEDVVQFEGWVNGEKKVELLEWANCFILPSYNEGLPISILEAMSYGMPVVSTPVGGITEVVKNGENGVIVEPGNKEQIWNALKHYLDNPEAIAVEGRKSLDIVRSYTPDFVLNDLKKIYEDLL